MPNRFLTIGAMIMTILGVSFADPIRADGLSTCVLDPIASALKLIPAGSLSGKDLPEHARIPELSGLTVATEPGGQTTFWTLSNEKKKLYPISIPGLSDKVDVAQVPIALKPKKYAKELEGLTFVPASASDPAGIVLISEKLKKGGAVLRADFNGSLTDKPRYLSEMKGYDTIVDPSDQSGQTLADYFQSSDSNDGLEGITYRPDRNVFYLLKEKSPAILIEVDGDLESVLSMTVLNCGSYKKACSGEAPFPSTLPGSDKVLDFSGLTYDPDRQKLWIVSDTGRSIFLYDPEERTAGAFPLKIADQCVEKAEGIAFLPRSATRLQDALLVVNDQEKISDNLLAAYWIMPL